jgi:hypothetical protein
MSLRQGRANRSAQDVQRGDHGRKDRIEFHDVAILAQNDRVVLCRVHGKVVSIAQLRLLPGTMISEHCDHGTLVVTRGVAEKLGLISP